MHSFTTDDLVLYLHQELPAPLTAALQLALLTDWALRQKLSILQEAHEQLQQLNLKKPRRQAVAAILSYLEKKEMA